MLGEGRGGGGNIHHAGELGTEKVLYEVIEEAVGADRPLPGVVCVGMAGMDRADDRQVVTAILRRLGFRGQTLAVNDALVALVAGADEEPGVVVVAGTGSIAYGVNGGGIAARAGGWGEVYGDEGSAFWVARLALQAVVRASDGRGPQTALTPLVLRHAGTDRIEGLVAQVYARPDRRQAIAAMAGLVARADADGDAVAGEVLSRAADELTLAARSVVEQLGMRGERFRVVLSGGLFKMAPPVAIDGGRSPGRTGAAGHDRRADRRTGSRGRAARAAGSGGAAAPAGLCGGAGESVMKVSILTTPQAVAEAAAAVIAETLASIARPVLGLPTGQTPLPLYARLRPAGLDWSRVRTFNLDEFLGLSPEHPGSFRRYMDEHLFDPLGLRPAQSASCAATPPTRPQNARATSAPLPPPAASICWCAASAPTGMSPSTSPGRCCGGRPTSRRCCPTTRAASAALFGGELARVPTHALTMGMSTILQARRILVLATGNGQSGGGGGDAPRAVDDDAAGVLAPGARGGGRAARPGRRGGAGAGRDPRLSGGQTGGAPPPPPASRSRSRGSMSSPMASRSRSLVRRRRLSAFW